MEFAVMVWNSENVRARSIFGVVDKAKPGQLPDRLSKDGHWEDYLVIDESRCPYAAAAKKAIDAQGYYLIGAGITVATAFGDRQIVGA